MPRTGRPPKPALARFAASVAAGANGCIEWASTIDRYGYGQFTPAGGRAAKTMGAHRWSYATFVGPIPSGYQIDHLCRNRSCVNPNHLEAVTPRENVMRSPVAPASVNAQKTHCLRGHEFTEANTLLVPQGRQCRACKRSRDLAHYYANRDEKNVRRNARRRELRRIAREAKEAA